MLSLDPEPCGNYNFIYHKAPPDKDDKQVQQALCTWLHNWPRAETNDAGSHSKACWNKDKAGEKATPEESRGVFPLSKW